MRKLYNEIIEKLDSKIQDCTVEHNDSILFFEVIIELILKELSEVKDIVLKKGFNNLEEEIHFFKKLKPLLLSKLIYYNAIYKIEAKKPYGGDKIVKKYLKTELSKLKKYFDNNLEFYKYYRTNSTYLDHKYFVRGKYDIKLSLDTYYFESDHNFTTSHDYKVAKILANDLLQLYLEEQLFKTPQIKKSINNSFLKWTGSKTAMIELIYALYSHGLIDNGNADIKHIAKTFENSFDIDLGDFYHTFMELKARKINRTKFLDSLRDALIKKMDEEDEI